MNYDRSTPTATGPYQPRAPGPLGPAPLTPSPSPPQSASAGLGPHQLRALALTSLERSGYLPSIGRITITGRLMEGDELGAILPCGSRLLATVGGALGLHGDRRALVSAGRLTRRALSDHIRRAKAFGQAGGFKESRRLTER
jgi:hypothetical protein